MKITFWGAVRTVTGSMHELAAGDGRVLLDCGLYQGRREESWKRNTKLPFPGASVRAVLLSHAHIDHSGNLPSLGKNGFDGPIYATPATVDLCNSMLKDSAHIQERDAAFVNKRRYRRKLLEDGRNTNHDIEPLYTIADAEKVLPQFQRAAYHAPFAVGDRLQVEYYDAGHLLGSAAMLITYTPPTADGKSRRPVLVAFSGDIGRKNLPIIRDPETLPHADYLVMESTYGNRLHKHDEVILNKLAGIINRTAGRGGRIIVPAFAVGRTQQLVLLLHQLAEQSAIPNIPIFVDSPLALDATEVYRRHPECYNSEAARYLFEGAEPLGFRRLRYVRDVNESKALNELRGPCIIISASGMCEAGRILHHLRNNISDPRNTVLIVGFQAEYTLGRKIVDRHPEVPVFGDPTPLRAEVATMNELSGHADREELLHWMKPLTKTLKTVFLVHGEISQAEPLAEAIRERYGIETVIPSRGDNFQLE
jgi:metallo-beta-lactamase family protein